MNNLHIKSGVFALTNFISRIGISPNCLVWISVFLTILLLSGCGGSGSGSGGSGSDSDEGNAGPEGGIVTSDNGEVTLDIPTGALNVPTSISITKNVSGGWELLPDGLTFNTPITATFRLPETPLLPDGSVRTGLPVMLVSSGGETEVPSQQILTLDADTNEASISMPLSHFSSVTQELVQGVSVTVGGLPDEPRKIGTSFKVSVTLETTAAVQLRAERVGYRDRTVGAVKTNSIDANHSDGVSLGAIDTGRAVKRTREIEYFCERAGSATFEANIAGQLFDILGLSLSTIPDYQITVSKRLLCIDPDAKDGSVALSPPGEPLFAVNVKPLGLQGPIGQSDVVHLTEEIRNSEPRSFLIISAGISDFNPGVVSAPSLVKAEGPGGVETELIPDATEGGGRLSVFSIDGLDLADSSYSQDLRFTCLKRGETYINYRFNLTSQVNPDVVLSLNLYTFFRCVDEVGSVIPETDAPNDTMLNAQLLLPARATVEGGFNTGDILDWFGVSSGEAIAVRLDTAFSIDQVPVNLRLTDDTGNDITCPFQGVIDASVGPGDSFISVMPKDDGMTGDYNFHYSAIPIDPETTTITVLNLDSNPLNCGACGNTCGFGESCVARQCVQPQAAECEDMIDGAVCGVNGDRQCSAGQCVPVPTPPAVCDGTNEGAICDSDGSQCIFEHCTEPPNGRNPILLLLRGGNFFGNIVGSVQFGIDSGNFTSYTNIPPGTALQLEAIPAAAGNSVFVNWEGAAVEHCGTNPICDFDLDGDSVVTANFNFPPSDDSKTLAVEVLGTGDGKVTMPGNINCGNLQTLTKCTATIFPLGGAISLTATASTGSVFSQWGGACQGQVGPLCIFGTADPFALGVGDPFAVTATFTAVP